MALVDDLAEKLALDVCNALDELGDDRFYDKVSKVLLEVSPTMQDAFNTAVKVILSERKGREYFDRALKARKAAQAKAAPGTGH